MKRNLLKAALVGGLCMGGASPSFAQQAIQQLPPTPIGSQADCPGGMQQVLSYSGSASVGVSAGINCVPIATDASGDMAASGYVQVGASPITCDPPHGGAIRFNAALQVFEGCSNWAWSPLGASVPTGTICGMQTNNAGFGPACQGYAPYNLTCPPGYSPNFWSVSFGNGRFMFCSKD